LFDDFLCDGTMTRSTSSLPRRRLFSLGLLTLICTLGAVVSCGEEEEEQALVIFDEDPRVVDYGLPCASDQDCLSGLQCELSVLEGRCTLLDCTSDTDCDAGTLCAPLGEGSACQPACDEDADCPAEHRCESFSFGQICLPLHLPHPAASFEETRDLFEGRCDFEPLPGSRGQLGPMYEIPFTLSEDTTSFMMVPYVTRGSVMAVSLNADGEFIDLRANYRHQNTRITDLFFFNFSGVGTFGEVTFDWPIMVPYAPQFNHLVKPGKNYKLFVTTNQAPPCFYLSESKRPGTTLDLNFYFLGLRDLNALNAAEHRDFQQILARFDAIYAQAGISIGRTRFFEVPDRISESYRIIRSMDDVYRLTAFGAPANDTLEGHLSVDVFMVQDILIPGGDGVLGMSPSLPGAAGMHGNARNGVVFHTADIGRANDYVAHIMAHEIGHYLGLRHTTETVHNTGTQQEQQIEQLIGTTDPFTDTPVCQDISTRIWNCPDIRNLMFPVAPPPQFNVFPGISAGQKAALQANPIIR
jgi:hypothetical protein